MCSIRSVILAASVALLTLGSGAASAQQSDMTFFVTSAGAGKGAELGGLAGADRLCQTLATAAGAGARTWRAYLSTQAVGGATVINARDRIGRGPWRNAAGVIIAQDVAELHGDNKLTKQTALTEMGTPVNGRGDNPNTHDILTGSQPDGTAFSAGEDRTCGNWSKGGTEGVAMVGHSDRTGLDESPPANSWNSSHVSRGGCSQDALKSTGGAGLLYCFAAE